MCAASAQYSNAKDTGLPATRDRGVHFARLARRSLNESNAPYQICRVQAYATLSLFEVQRGNGLQAWSDLGTVSSFLSVDQAYTHQLPRRVL